MFYTTSFILIFQNFLPLSGSEIQTSNHDKLIYTMTDYLDGHLKILVILRFSTENFRLVIIISDVPKILS